MNFWHGTLDVQGNTIRLQVGDAVLELPPSVVARFTFADQHHGSQVVVGVRPEHMHIASTDTAPGTINTMHVGIDLVETMGADAFAYFTCNARPAHSQVDETASLDSHDGIFTARVPATTPPAVGTRQAFTIDTAGIQLFEVSSELSLLAPRVPTEPAHIPIAEPVQQVVGIDPGPSSADGPRTPMFPRATIGQRSADQPGTNQSVTKYRQMA